MGQINILDSSIFNRIAAGEVVESPHSVVKELVENSIDAGATKIEIAIENGGIDLLCVTDNGRGIEKSDIEIAFLPHATSKIISLDCLNAIATLGFRGEALPSIASVASVTLTSKRAADTLGYFVSYEYGKLVQKGEAGAGSGTQVSVKGLFAKIPARKKFLKKPVAEAARITDLVKKMILANPCIAFKYAVDGDTVFNTDGLGLQSAVYTIYGDLVEQMHPISYIMSGITIRGYASKPALTKHNRTYQTIIVNNRVVENEEIAYSIYLAYKDFLMTRRFPVYVLYIDIPYDLIDVNVHPNKMQVKFVDITGVKKMVYHAMRKIASTHDVLFRAAAIALSVDTPQSLPIALDAEPFVQATAIPAPGTIFGVSNRRVTDDAHASLMPAKSESHDVYSCTHNVATHILQDSQMRESAASVYAPTRQTVMESFLQSQVKMPEKEADDFAFSSSLQIVGKMFNTYLTVQTDNDVFLIDQHAAHERILYDRYIKQADTGALVLQPLLIPYAFSLDADEADALQANLVNLAAIGFTIEPTKDKEFLLTKIPAMLAELNLKDFVAELFTNPHTMHKRSDFIKEKIAQSACKAAVKAGDDLSRAEIITLLKQTLKKNTTPLCPHGRPIIVELTKTQIESWFKRI